MLISGNWPSALQYLCRGIRAHGIDADIYLVRNFLEPGRLGVAAVAAFGFITLFFGAGQITGPAVAGYLADMTGTFSMAFWMCALLTVSAVVLAYFLRTPSKA